MSYPDPREERRLVERMLDSGPNIEGTKVTKNTNESLEFVWS